MAVASESAACRPYWMHSGGLPADRECVGAQNRLLPGDD
jgi:hypothetical protein